MRGKRVVSFEERNATWPDWWDEAPYDHTVELTRRGWAWEFLRRNPAFQHDLAHALNHASYTGTRPSLAIIESGVDLSRWGALFRKFIGTRRGRLLVAASLPTSPAGHRPCGTHGVGDAAIDATTMPCDAADPG
ncbi:transcriptional regulator domain-containing protein [Mesorhizobium sp. J8]|uniref:transcriptional regulator domain-containing protein n=1 Tax=Mesorhizobium sp. J8 TaxID=2777475 RepID=UPI001CD82929